MNIPSPILTIAGSDSSGGAGIQADLKTIQACGGYGMSAITALTAQNTLGVHGVQAVTPEFVAQQITAVLDDIPPRAIKTGMLANAEIVQTVVQTLAEAKRQKNIQATLIIDPVMIAKGGASLLDDSAIDAVKHRLIPLAALVTPNIPETEFLTGVSIHTVEDMKEAATRIVALGCQAALIKGGHLNSGDEVHNILMLASGEQHVLTSPRIHTQHTHGTGCTLSAAIATYLGQGTSMLDACKKAEAYVAGAIANAPGLGAGHGPLGHSWNMSDTE